MVNVENHMQCSVSVVVSPRDVCRKISEISAKLQISAHATGSAAAAPEVLSRFFHTLPGSLFTSDVPGQGNHQLIIPDDFRGNGVTVLVATSTSSGSSPQIFAMHYVPLGHTLQIPENPQPIKQKDFHSLLSHSHAGMPTVVH